MNALKHAVPLLLIVGLFIWVKWDRTSQGPYLYDEADYMFAASLGPAANAFDSPSRPLSDFLSIGWAALQRKGTGGPGLSQLTRSGVDVNFYRRTHGPVYYYWLSVFDFWRSTEGTVRLWTLVFPIAS